MTARKPPAGSESIAAAADAKPAATRPDRPPLKEVCVLLPIWGDRVIREFLDFSLMSLLAPGNLPALAEECPCTFVLMTAERFLPMFTEDYAWQRLSRLCRVEVCLIDDLITSGNHTATITLAFERVIRERGPDALDTCFLLWMADFIVADGSLRNVLKAIQAGASAVMAGNFQIVGEDATELFDRQAHPYASHFAMSSRDLIAWSLGHLHASTIANFADFGLNHNSHTNRLFWRVDETTLIGRFYLMHIIAIRPETLDFRISSSFDYSFIPELCPSNRLAVMTDSDDYFVVEIQRRAYESNNLTIGPHAVDQLGQSLSEWTTANHRGNVRHTIVYHAQNAPADRVARVIAKADAFLDEVSCRLAEVPQTHRNHPYWIGSIAVHKRDTARPLEKRDWEFLRTEWPEPKKLARRLGRARLSEQAYPPKANWHPRHPDFAPLEAALDGLPPDARVLLVTHQPQIFADWLIEKRHKIATLPVHAFMNATERQFAPLLERFDACLLIFDEGEFRDTANLFRQARAVLRPEGKATLLILNDRRRDAVTEFAPSLKFHLAQIRQANVSIDAFGFLSASKFQLQLQRKTRRLARACSERRGPMSRMATLVAAFGVVVASKLLGRRNRVVVSDPVASLCSSCFVTFSPIATALPVQVAANDLKPVSLADWPKRAVAAKVTPVPMRASRA